MSVALPLGVAVLVVATVPARGLVVGLVLASLLVTLLALGLAVTLGFGGGLRRSAQDRAEQCGHHGASPAGATEEAGELIEAGGIHGASPGECGTAGGAARGRGPADPRRCPDACQSLAGDVDRARGWAVANGAWC
jgi:hypothetical protein